MKDPLHKGINTALFIILTSMLIIGDAGARAVEKVFSMPESIRGYLKSLKKYWWDDMIGRV